MGKTVTADFGDEPKSARHASAPNDHRRRDASPSLTLAGANVCAKVAELTHDDRKVGAYPTELIVQKSEQLGLMINS
jgi:hypothetical protein